jgi:hypothetical protein
MSTKKTFTPEELEQMRQELAVSRARAEVRKEYAITSFFLALAGSVLVSAGVTYMRRNKNATQQPQ